MAENSRSGEGARGSREEEGVDHLLPFSPPQGEAVPEEGDPVAWFPGGEVETLTLAERVRGEEERGEGEKGSPV